MTCLQSTRPRPNFESAQPWGCVSCAGDCRSRPVNFLRWPTERIWRERIGGFKDSLTGLFERFTAKLSVIVIEIRLQGDVAYDYGWHDLTLDA